MSSIVLIQSAAASSRSWEKLLANDARCTIASSVNSLADARRVLARRPPDLLIADLRLPDGPISALLRDLRPGRSHVLVTTASLHDPHLMHALRSGADGFLLAGWRSEAVLNTIRYTLAGGSPLAPEIARAMLELLDVMNARPVPFDGARARQPSAAERQLLDWAGEGYLADELARRFDVTPLEIGHRVRALYRRIRFERPAGRALRRAA